MSKEIEKIVDYSTTAEVARRSTIVDAFKAWGRTFKALLGKQEDNPVLKDLGVKKGFWSGVKYMMWFTLVLPANIITFFLSPRWEYLRFLERSILTPIIEMSVISGENTPSSMTGAIYEKYLNHFSNTKKMGVADASLKPDTSTIERIVSFAKLRSVASMLIVSLGALKMYEMADYITDLLSSALGGLFGMVSFATTDILGLGFGVVAIAKVITYFLISYLMIIFVTFLVEAFKNIAYTRSEMVQNFVDDSLNYTVAKSVENFGEDIACKAYELLLENVVIQTEQKSYDVYNFDKLENWKNAKRIEHAEEI